MSEWKEYNIADIADVIGGGTPKTSVEEYWNGDISWLSVVDFNTGKKYVSTTEKTITELGLDKSSTKLLQANDIIISARGTVGALAMLNSPMTFNQSCYGMRAKEDKTTNDYLFYLLKDTVKQLQQVSYGAVFDTITRNTFDETSILLPPLKEQKEIAEVLSSLDDKIDLLHRQNKTLEELAQTLFRQYFVEELKDGWEDVELGSVVETTSGGTPSRKKMEYYENGKYIWVKSKELNGSFLIETEENITEEALKNSSAKLLPKNSILIAMYGATVGEYTIITEEMTCNQAICALKPNKDYPYTFLYMFVKNYKEEIINMAVGSAQQNISQLLIKQLPIYSNVKLISKFHKEVEPLFEKIKSSTKQVKTLENMRDTLLPKLMSGEVRVKI